MFKFEEYIIMCMVSLILFFTFYGWIENIIKLSHADIISGINCSRLVGIFVVPLGVIMGYL